MKQAYEKSTGYPKADDPVAFAYGVEQGLLLTVFTSFNLFSIMFLSASLRTPNLHPASFHEPLLYNCRGIWHRTAIR